MIGKRLKKIRAERKLTQRKLAKLSGVSNVQIANYEKDKANPSPIVVKKLASALNISVDYFFDASADLELLFDQTQFDNKWEKIRVLPTHHKILLEALFDKFLATVWIDDAVKDIHN